MTIYLKNNLFLLLLILLSLNANSQEFKGSEITKIENFGIDFKSLNKADSNIQKDLNSILLLDKKRKRRKTASIILGSLSAVTATIGIIQVAKKSDNRNDSERNEAGAYENLIGSLLIAVGTIEAGSAIPLFISSKKKKRKRNELIKVYNQDFN